MRSRGIFLAAVLLAAALRFPGLALRPMHADEAVHADKLGTLLEGGGYVYDPSEYHGPTLYYLTLPSAWLRGASRYVEVDEVILRAVPAALGVALVAAHLGARAFLGVPGAAVAAMLAALSPAMVFYSRYYIHETPLVFFTFGALLGGCGYLRKRATALQTGACVGLMHATKETRSRCGHARGPHLDAARRQAGADRPPPVQTPRGTCCWPAAFSCPVSCSPRS
jgi:uncharacterized protein (TIGR03663 family)